MFVRSDPENQRFMSDTPAAQSPPSFEIALTQLQQIVADLEEGRLGLEPSLARYEEGIRLLRNCHRILEQAEQKIELLVGTDAMGNPETAPFDATATFDAAETNAKKKARRRAAPKASQEPGPQPGPIAEPSTDADDDDDGAQRLF